MFDIASLCYTGLEHLRVVFIFGRDLVVRGGSPVHTNVIWSSKGVMGLSHVGLQDHFFVPERLLRVEDGSGEVVGVDGNQRVDVDVGLTCKGLDFDAEVFGGVGDCVRVALGAPEADVVIGFSSWETLQIYYLLHSNQLSTNGYVSFTLAAHQHGIITILAKTIAVSIKLSEIAIFPSRPHNESLGGVGHFVTLKNKHFKLRKFILVDSANFNLFNGVIIRNHETNDALLVLLEIDIVHLPRSQVDLRLK